jgi:ferredoxin
MPRRPLKIAAFLGAAGSCWLARGEERFPPPDFESGYKLPPTTAPAGHWWAAPYVDILILAACLAIAVWMIYKARSRRGVFWLSLFSLAYFGFYRKGCVCAIGSAQNVAYGLFQPDYAVPWSVLAFFVLPLAVALFAGRAFCAGACPQGALQDLFLIKPVKVPRWLEHALGIIPFLFLGAGVVFAATGTGFMICRFDPFVPLFRLSGSSFILAAGAAFLVVGTFVGRPYCRFLCPYGALLKMAALVATRRVRVTPDYCTQCRLCENSCPFGVIRQPSSGGIAERNLFRERRRLGWLLASLPLLIAAGAWLGFAVSPALARLHPAVELADRYAAAGTPHSGYGPVSPETLALERAARTADKLSAEAITLRHRFKLAGALFGAWVGLVIGVKLISLSVQYKRADFEPERGGCFACARCFLDCPNERVRRGEIAAIDVPVTTKTTA